jgi:predicted transcriptional regulator
MGKFENSADGLRAKWDLQQPWATQWPAYLSISPTALRDIEELMVTLAYAMGKVKESKEAAEVAEQVAGAVGGA